MSLFHQEPPVTSPQDLLLLTSHPLPSRVVARMSLFQTYCPFFKRLAFFFFFASHAVCKPAFRNQVQSPLLTLRFRVMNTHRVFRSEHFSFQPPTGLFFEMPLQVFLSLSPDVHSPPPPSCPVLDPSSFSISVDSINPSANPTQPPSRVSKSFCQDRSYSFFSSNIRS